MDLASLTPAQRAALKAEAERVLATQSLLAFSERSYLGYMAPKHVKLILAHLEMLEAGTINKLAVFLPPRHSKSFNCSERFPAWYLGRNPTKSVIAVSYNQDLANQVSRKVRDIVTAAEWPFDGVSIRDDSRAVEQWQLNKGGQYIAAGVGGSLTGKGADLLIMDDVIKSREDVDSLEKRNAMSEWFSEVASTRLMPGGKTMYVTTRWADDDLAARLVAQGGWTVLTLPAIAGSNDILGRQPGEALWPEFYPIEVLLQKKADMSSRSWQALYACDPAPADGTVVKAEWLSYTYDGPVPTIDAYVASERDSHSRVPGLPGGRKLIRRPAHIVQAVDASWGTGTASDYSAIATVAYDEQRFYVLDLWRGRVPHPELTRMVEQKFNQFGPQAVVIEAASAGHAVIQSLKSLNRIPIFPIPPRSSKTARLESISVLLERGQVLFPTSAPWLAMVLEEFLRFPNAAHDDCVDAIVYAISSLWSATKLTPDIASTIGRLSAWQRQA